MGLLRWLLMLPILVLLAPIRLVVRLLGFVPLSSKDASGRRAPLLVPLGLNLDDWRARRGPSRGMMRLTHRGSGVEVMLSGSLGPATAAMEQLRTAWGSPRPEEGLAPGLRLTLFDHAPTGQSAWVVEGASGWLALRGPRNADVEALVRSVAPFTFAGPALARFEEAQQTWRQGALLRAAADHVFDVTPSPETAALRLVNERLRREHVAEAATLDLAPGLSLAAVSQGTAKQVLRQVSAADLAALGLTFSDWQRLALARLDVPPLVAVDQFLAPRDPDANVSLALFGEGLRAALHEKFGPRWIVGVPSHGYFLVGEDSDANVAALRSRLQKLAAADLTDLSVDVYRVQSGTWSRV